MTQSATVYLNFDCGTCRKAHELLTKLNASRDASSQLEFKVVEYVKEPLDVQQITTLLGLLFQDDENPNPLRMMRVTSKEFSELGLDKLDPLNNPQHARELIEAMAQQPLLIARPIFVLNGRAIIARPPELILELLDDSFKVQEVAKQNTNDYC